MVTRKYCVAIFEPNTSNLICLTYHSSMMSAKKTITNQKNWMIADKAEQSAVFPHTRKNTPWMSNKDILLYKKFKNARIKK